MRNAALSSFFFLLAVLATAQSERYITVVGEARMQARPDLLYYRVTIQSPEAYPAYADYDAFDPVKYQERQAEMELKAEMAKRAFFDLLGRAGIDREAIVEDPFTVKPTAVYGNSEVVIKVSDVEALLSFIAQIRENRQYSGSLIRAEYSGRAKAMQSLRREALGDAKTKASEMARALGASIGPPLAIVELPPVGQFTSGDSSAWWNYGQDEPLLPQLAGQNQNGLLSEDNGITLLARVEVRFLLKD